MVDVSLQPVDLLFQHRLPDVLQQLALELGVRGVLDWLLVDVGCYFFKFQGFGPLPLKLLQKLLFEVVLPDPEMALCFEGQV